MTAVEIAALLKDYGPWGLVGLFGAVIVVLYRANQDCTAAQIKMVERLVTALEAAKDASDRLSEAQRALGAMIDTRGQAVGDLSRQVELIAEKMTHGFGNLAQSLESFLRLLERERDRADRGRP